MTGKSAPHSQGALAPVALPKEPDSPAIDGEDFWSDQKPMCSPLYEDILYVTGQRRFWLIPKRLKEKLDEAATTLREKVAIKADRAERMSSIADAGLLDYFLTPGPESFLDASDDEVGERRRYLEAKEALAQERESQQNARQAWKEPAAKETSILQPAKSASCSTANSAVQRLNSALLSLKPSLIAEPRSLAISARTVSSIHPEPYRPAMRLTATSVNETRHWRTALKCSIRATAR